MRFTAALTSTLASLASVALLVVGACGGTQFSAAPGDGGAPALVDGASEAGRSFCALEAGAHSFCDDFDGAPLSVVWDSINATNGSASTDSSASLSAPSSFASSADATTSATASSQGRLSRSLRFATHVVVAYSVRIDALGPKPVVGGSSLCTIGFGPDYTVGISVNNQTIGYFEDATSDAGVAVPLQNKALLPSPGLVGKWARVVLDVDTAAAKISVSINGTKELDAAALTPPPGPRAATLYLGAFARNVSTAVAAHFDDVTVDASP